MVSTEATNVVSSSMIPSTLTMEPKHSSETSALTRTAWRHIPEDGTLLLCVPVVVL
jgi:hypothetical protein